MVVIYQPATWPIFSCGINPVEKNLLSCFTKSWLSINNVSKYWAKITMAKIYIYKVIRNYKREEKAPTGAKAHLFSHSQTMWFKGHLKIKVTCSRFNVKPVCQITCSNIKGILSIDKKFMASAKVPKMPADTWAMLIPWLILLQTKQTSIYYNELK